MKLADHIPDRLAPGRLFYGWYIVLAGATNNFFFIGMTVFGLGVFFQPMRDELGWSMAAIMVGVSLKSFEQGLLAPATGYLVDRFGPRRMAVTGVTLVSVGLLMFSQAYVLWFYYLAALTIALGQAMGASSAFSLAVMNWFHQKRGRAMGLMNSGNAFGTYLVPVLALLVSTIGWRPTLMVAAVTIFVCCIPMALVIRLRPEPYGYAPDGGRLEPDDVLPVPKDPGRRPSSGPDGGPTGLTVAEALRTPAFYLLALMSCSSSATQTVWNSLQVPHLLNVGFSLGVAGVLVAVYGTVQVALRIGTGWLGDTLGRRRLLIAAFAFQSVGFMIFAHLTVSRLWLLPLFYLTYGLGHASMVVLSQTVVADYFGTRRYATIRGLSGTLATPAGVIAPVVAGWLYDQSGSYYAAFMLNGVIVITGSLWLLLIRRPMWSAVQTMRPVAAGVRETA